MWAGATYKTPLRLWLSSGTASYPEEIPRSTSRCKSLARSVHQTTTSSTICKLRAPQLALQFKTFRSQPPKERIVLSWSQKSSMPTASKIVKSKTTRLIGFLSPAMRHCTSLDALSKILTRLKFKTLSYGQTPSTRITIIMI